MHRRSLLHLFAAAAALVSFAGAARADVITFDDLPFTGVESQIPNGYHGLSWFEFGAINTAASRSTYGTDGYSYSVVSGTNVAFNDSGGEADLSAAVPFAFNSAYFTGAFNNGLNVTVIGRNGVGTLLFSKTFTVNTTSPTLETFNWSGVSSLAFTSSGGVSAGYNTGFGENFAMDNLTVNQAAASTPLPKSATAGLSLLGLLVLSRLRRRPADRLARR